MLRHLAVLLLALGAAPAAAGERTKLAVIDLTDKGVGKDASANVTDLITGSLSDLGVFDVLSRADIQQMVAFEGQKQALGCESDTSCLAELGGALGVALLISGSVGKIGSSYFINLALTDTRVARVISREQREVASLEALAEQAKAAARYLVRELLAGKQGELIVKTSESGADVEIDGRLVGVTPLPRQQVASGPHTVRITKKGFVAWARDVSIKENEPQLLDAALIPSIEFIEAYEDSARSWRVMAYVSGGLGIAATAFGAYGYFVYNANRAAAFNREVSAAGCDASAPQNPSLDCDASFGERRSSIERFDLVSTVAGWVGIAALGTGIYLFTQGPTPGLYDQYRPATSVQVGLAPLPGGAAVMAEAPF